ncbi:S-layer glycoprotein N-glycosyltransferase AglJ [Thermococcus sp. JdF3]|uniref:S-layer glycoprotein N-glycosyltransferase AglJ n=1 Tax=Thermococcus sp. JdF3 TaxID=1638258 RepID=UPI0014393EA0|nr:S-layer glycoprotein N-glycosyltransferase AglJ [Thermococcus sp. JdF3]NJE00448.1 S-layer glycoprotein N-glycosyltransferase AglJ [Thermococcus sp. JdF3]
MKKLSPKDVTILIPTKNEEDGIGEVIDGFRELGYTSIFVIDGHSTDRTREIAREKGATVVLQSGKGKGQAVAEAFKMIDTPVIVMIDGDGTYDPKDVEKLLQPIERGIADHVIGNRLENYEDGAFTKLNLIGNKIFNALFRFMYGVKVHDLLTGYRAFTKELYKSMELEKHGFEIETELTVETIAKGFRIAEVPISYRKRKGQANLHPIKDGWRIGRTIIELMIRYNPGKYLYLLGFISLLVGFIMGFYVIEEWQRGVTHYLLAPLTSIFVITGINMVIFGFVTGYIFKSMASLRRDMRRITPYRNDKNQ